MANFHAADLWVAVVPDTSKVGPEMEKAGKESKTKFDSGIKGIGKGVDAELKSVGDRAKDAFSKAGKDAGTNFGQELKTTVTQQVKGAFSDVASDLRSGDLSGAIDGVKGKIGGISDVAKQVGIDLSGWVPSAEAAKQPIDDVGSSVKDALGGVTGITSMFEGMPGKIGAAATKMGEFAVVIGGAVEAASQLLDVLGKVSVIHDRFMDEQGRPPEGSIDDWFDKHGFGWLNELDPNYHRRRDVIRPPSQGPSGIHEPIPYPEHFIGPIPADATRAPGGQWGPPPSAPSPYKDWYGGGSSSGEPEAPAPSEPRSSRGGGGDGGSSGGGGRSSGLATPSATDRKSLYGAGSRVANLYAFAQSLVGTPYSMPLRNDCSGMVAELASVALGLPPPSAGERFSTANEEDWLMSHGFQPGLGGVGDLNIGWHIGGPAGGHTAATLPGGVHAEQGGATSGFTVGPGAAGAENPEFEHHAHLAMGGRGPMPVGTKADPLYTTDAAADGAGGAGGNQYAQDFGSSFVTGMMQAVGLDGSVFKSFTGKGPLDWGITKLGTGLINELTKTSDKPGGGGMLGGMLGGMPGGDMISALAQSANPNAAAALSGGGTTIINGDVNPFNVTQHGVAGSGVPDWQQQANAYAAQSAAAPVNP